MDCPDCGGATVTFTVTDEFREFVPRNEQALALCAHCLALHPDSTGDADSHPDFSTIGDAFPTGEAAVPMALAVGLLDSLALYRAEVETLLVRVERAGTDPLLVLDRLAADSALDPQVDLAARRRQVAQFREE